MKNQLIAEITRQMLPHLDNAQIEQLQNVLRHCLWNVEVTESDFLYTNRFHGKCNNMA